ncbi:hypothetical protein [Nocardia sp. NBC_01329]|uniref:hypothetical protein n=1 Tax=Nocardia sp. NBC_01329 TaxID=2903594 RepID=UPI002E0D49DF|nr:hypothetical protein OG405_23575 [Nocardia sp. NBC_01329]
MLTQDIYAGWKQLWDGGRSMKQFAGDAVPNTADERSRLFDRAADHVLAVGAELNRRLA